MHTGGVSPLRLRRGNETPEENREMAPPFIEHLPFSRHIRLVHVIESCLEVDLRNAVVLPCFGYSLEVDLRNAVVLPCFGYSLACTSALCATAQQPIKVSNECFQEDLILRD